MSKHSIRAGRHPRMLQPFTERERTFRHRWIQRLGMGAAIGAAVGGLIGLVLGLTLFDAWSRGMWGSAIGGAVAGLLLAGFIGGMSALESPQPGHEPLETEHPLRDAEGLTSEEHQHGR